MQVSTSDPLVRELVGVAMGVVTEYCTMAVSFL